jgi:peptidoglycan hydrolase CwlO-like protein
MSNIENILSDWSDAKNKLEKLEERIKKYKNDIKFEKD